MGACCAAREESTKVALDISVEKDKTAGLEFANDNDRDINGDKLSKNAVAVSSKTLEVSDTGSLKGDTPQFLEY